MISRRWFVALSGLAALLAGCASTPAGNNLPPVVFVHGNGDTAALWQTTLWRFESNGWPRDRLHAIELPYPLARDDDSKAQPGRTSSAESMAFLKAEVDKVLKATGASRVVLMGNSRGGYPIRNYIVNGGGDASVSHAILSGTPNHGVWNFKGFLDNSEFNGTGPFLSSLNAPRNAAGDEVTGPVRWLTIRSDNNDKFAQPDGVWLGRKGTPTNVGFDGPALKGATNIVIARIDHRETAYSQAAFEAAYRFITGQAPKTATIMAEAAPVLNGRITGMGLDPSDAASGNFVNNLPIPGAQLDIFQVDPNTGERLGASVHSRKVGADGVWGPFSAREGARYEFVITAPGYATTHIYRSPFARSSDIIHLRAERLTAADQKAMAAVSFTRPRGYFDASRDRMNFDGAALPGVPPTGAGVAESRLRLSEAPGRAISAEFNGERITGRSWSAAENHTTTLELTY